MSVSSSAKESCRSKPLKRWLLLTEMRWKRKAASPDTDEMRMRRPSAFKNSIVEVLRAPKFSTDIGWKTWFCWKSLYLTDFLSAACSETKPDSIAATSTYESASVAYSQPWVRNTPSQRLTILLTFYNYYYCYKIKKKTNKFKTYMLEEN